VKGDEVKGVDLAICLLVELLGGKMGETRLTRER
jgi:hypothetical protein